MFAFALCITIASQATAQAPTSAFLIRDVPLFDGERVLEHRNVSPAAVQPARLVDAEIGDRAQAGMRNSSSAKGR